MQYLFQELQDFLLYDVLKVKLPVPEGFHEGIFSHKVQIAETKDGYFIAKSENYPNLYAVGKDLEDLREAFYDTILTYFDIPRYYSKRRIDDFKLINLKDGQTIQAKTLAGESFAKA